MAISEQKRRYSVTLSPSIVNRFQGLCKEFNMPSNTMSNVCNDAIQEVSELFVTAKQQGKFSIADVFRLMGQKCAELIEEEKKESEEKRNVPEQKRNSVSNKKGSTKHA